MERNILFNILNFIQSKSLHNFSFNWRKFIHLDRFVNYSSYDDYDMALLTTTEPIIFSHHVVPICLPKIAQDFVGKTGTVAGWWEIIQKINSLTNLKFILRGRTKDSLSNEYLASELLETRISIKPVPHCDKVFRRALINYNTESMFCGFQRNTDACQVKLIFTIYKLLSR